MSPFIWTILSLLLSLGTLTAGRSSSSTFCADRSGGLYADPKDCQKYIQCASGTEYRGTCPRRTLFSDKMGVCDWANQVDCKQVAGGKDPNYTTDKSVPRKSGISSRGKCCACPAKGMEAGIESMKPASAEMEDAPAAPAKTDATSDGSGPLNSQDVEAIEKSFGLVAASGSAKDIGIGLFRRLFTAYPEWLTKYFAPKFGDKPLEEFLQIPRFQSHATGVVGKVGEWVGYLRNPEALVLSIQQNARNHAKRGLGTQHYKDISAVILADLAAILGESLTPAMATGWTKLLDTMVDIVSSELDPISTTDVRNIQKSFTLVANSASITDLGVGFFRLLFTTHPDWKAKYFSHIGDEPLEEFLALPRFRSHAGGVIAKLGHWVSSLDDIGMLAESIKQNARNHKARGIGTKQYKTLSGVLLSYLAAGLGDSLTTEMATAWTKMLDTMVTLVQQELKD